MRIALLALVLCLTGSGCGGNDESEERKLLELRPVLSTSPPPCATGPEEGKSLVLPLEADGQATECLELGEPIVDGKDVRSATVARTPAGAPALSVVLGRVGSANLDAFAGRSRGRRLAILADGEVVNAPEVRFPSFAGRVQVTGLSPEETDDLFRRLEEVIRP